jgi:hypothetical protein
MAEGPGFWSDRPRSGSDDAQLLLAEHVHALRELPYAELRDRGDEVVHVSGPSGERYVRRTRVVRAKRGSGEELRVLVQVDDGTRAGRLDPLAEELLLVGPEGEMLGEYTLASEGNDPRRYVWPAPWVPWVMVGILAALIAVAVLAA